MKLKSFGCSFVYGNDLADQIDWIGPGDMYSKKTWPALIADRFGLDYECYAEPGIGNFKILCQIVREASLRDPAIFVVNWTWINRFDYVDQNEHWCTIRPGIDSQQARLYYREFHSQIKDMMASAYNVNTAIDMLTEHNIPFVMTYMDYTMLESVDPNWHDPKYLTVIQNKVKKYMSSFGDKNFLDWSKENGYPISETWHPLEQAHAAAADLMQPAIDAILHKA